MVIYQIRPYHSKTISANSDSINIFQMTEKNSVKQMIFNDIYLQNNLDMIKSLKLSGLDNVLTL